MTREITTFEAAAHAFGADVGSIERLPGDASSRRYARVQHPENGRCLLLLDTPGTAHFENFLTIGAHLNGLGLSAPRIHATDHAGGAALIEDLGSDTYTRLIESGHDEAALYDLATDVLVALHEMASTKDIDVPAYDKDLLLGEVSLLPDWFAPAVGHPLVEDLRAEHQALWAQALGDVAEARETLVLRDFHVDNLMVVPGRAGVAACGLLDFQDGRIGATAYDLVSLTQDARRDLSDGLEARCLERYFEGRPGVDRGAFMVFYHLLGAQRHAKVAGIFHRLHKRDGKPSYLRHVPRVLTRLEASLEACGLGEITAFYDTHIPAWRRPSGH